MTEDAKFFMKATRLTPSIFPLLTPISKYELKAGSIIPGAFIFEMIRNGLTNLGADPYSYRLVGGAVIFAAMYVDALKSGRLSLRRKTAS